MAGAERKPRDGFTMSPPKDGFYMHYIMRASAIKDEIAAACGACL
jgi:hypothetical protein